MPANYFGSTDGKRLDIDKLTSDKISKIRSPTGGKVVLSETNGQIKESLISVHDLSLIKVKDTMDISSFVDGEPRLLKLDKSVNYTTAFYTLMFESKIKTEKRKKFKIVYTANGVNYSVVKEWTIEPNQKFKQLVTNFTLSRGTFYNFEIEIEGVTNLGDVFDFIRLEWYTAEG